MSIFNKIRQFFGLKSEEEYKSPIEILDENLVLKKSITEDLNKAKNEFDEICNELQLKIKACDKLIEKGISDGFLNKEIISNRLERIEDEYLDKLKTLNGQLKEVDDKIVALESDILKKSIEFVSLMSDEEQKKVNEIILAWKETKLIKGEIVDYELKAIVESINIVTGLSDIQKKSLNENDSIEKSHHPLAEIMDDSFEEYENDFTGHYANIIVKRDGKILFLKRANHKVLAPGQYCLPGGHIDEGESIQEAASRELKEETNLDCTPDSLYIAGKAKCSDGKWAFYLYGGCAEGEVALLDGESSNAEWMEVGQWLESDLIFDLKQHLIALEIPEEVNIDEIPTLNKSIDIELIKGNRGAGIGEKRVWNGIEYVKTHKGWIRTKHSKSSKKQEELEKRKKFKHTAEQLTTHAENTSTDQLKKIVSDESKEQHLRDAAKRELERRSEGDKGQEGNKENGSQKKKSLKEKFKDWHSKQKEMYKHGHHEPHSEERKTLSQLIKKKAKGIVAGIKHEVHEWKEAGSGLKKFFSGKKGDITDHEKKAMKALATHLAITIGMMAVTGGIGAGLKSGIHVLGKNITLHYLEHAGITRLAHAALFASQLTDLEKAELEGMTEEEAIKKLINELVHYVETANISEEDWADMSDKADNNFHEMYGSEKDEGSEDKE